MSKKINTTSIGLFIVTGVALGVAGLLLFSSARLFSRTQEVIVYFDQSLNGLSEGAPVKFRGVTIGSVTRVMVRYNQATNDYAMPVIFEVDEKLLRDRLGDDDMEVFTPRILEQRIQGGLRATLQSESIVTGVLYIGIHPNPNAPPPVFHQLRKHYPEIPSEPTEITQLMKNLASLDIKSIETNLNALLLKLDTVIEDLHMADINRGITNVLHSVDRLVSSPDITNALASVRPALEQYRELGAKLTSKIDPLADSVTNSLGNADLALAQLRDAAENLRILLAPEAPLPVNLDQVLEQLSTAGESLSELLDFLKRHPNALITGRKAPDKKP